MHHLLVIIIIMKQIMGTLRKEILMGCFSLLLLVMIMILVFENSSTSADGYTEFQSFKKGSPSEYDISPLQSNTPGENTYGDNTDSTLVDEKRRIHTGPNPLHNR
ncbi:hypothetical protein CsatB_028653 [Cannabis sativa]